MLAIVVVGCGGTPGADKPSDQASKPASSIKTSGFENLGPTTLTVVSSEGSGGPRDAIKELTKQFEQKYPNVTVKLQFRDFASWIKQVKLVASGDSPPDVFAGNQGYQVDGELVKAGLILPLDQYAKAYGWDKSFTPETLQQFEWSKDGQSFGSGTLYGVAQSGQSTGVFANMAKLKAAGVDPASLKTFDDFDAALAKLRSSLPAERAGDRARQQGPVRRDPHVGHGPGRLRLCAVDPRLDLPQGRRDVRHARHRRVAEEDQGVG